MVRRIVALVLIGAWHLQGALPPHFHAGMSPSDLVSHGERRHFHWSQVAHAHDDHSTHAHPCTFAADHDQSAGDFAAPLCDHDDDAVYVEAGSAADVTTGAAHLAALDATTTVAFGDDATRSLGQHTSAPPRYGGQMPALLSSTRLLL